MINRTLIHRLCAIGSGMFVLALASACSDGRVPSTALVVPGPGQTAKVLSPVTLTPVAPATVRESAVVQSYQGQGG